jgi:putative adenylate-forming enzyme
MLWHFVLTRWFSPFRDREELDAIPQHKLHSFLETAVRESPFYQGFMPTMDALPLMNKSSFLKSFEALNRRRITLDEATRVALRAEHDRDFKTELPGGLTVGLSSGTSGSRHVFLVSRADRCRWAGQMLARMLTNGSLWRVINPFAEPLRIAFFLRASSKLYTTFSVRRVRLNFYDLTRSFTSLTSDLATQQPHVIVAPATRDPRPCWLNWRVRRCLSNRIKLSP